MLRDETVFTVSLILWSPVSTPGVFNNVSVLSAANCVLDVDQNNAMIESMHRNVL